MFFRVCVSVCVFFVAEFILFFLPYLTKMVPLKFLNLSFKKDPARMVGSNKLQRQEKHVQITRRRK